MRLKGKDYLEVKWRLVWLRLEHPDAQIKTGIAEHNREDGYARAWAEVTLPNGGSATGQGTETSADFPDYLEKAETKALGRALAALGYGTQFADDWEMLNPDGSPHVVDAPVSPNKKKAPAKASPAAPLPATPAATPGAPRCEDCGSEIPGGPTRDGKWWSAESRADWMKKRSGRVRCLDCYNLAQQQGQA